MKDTPSKAKKKEDSALLVPITTKDIKALHKAIDELKGKRPDAVGKVYNNGIEMARTEVQAWLIKQINKAQHG
jgi:hypothetical protein